MVDLWSIFLCAEEVPAPAGEGEVLADSSRQGPSLINREGAMGWALGIGGSAVGCGDNRQVENCIVICWAHLGIIAIGSVISGSKEIERDACHLRRATIRWERSHMSLKSVLRKL